MTNRKLSMPGHVSDLVHMSLTRMGLDPFKGDDMITCPLMYEDGTELSIVFMCVPKRRWFWEATALLVSLVQMDHETKAVTVYSRDTIDCPTEPYDWHFTMLLPHVVRAIARRHAVEGGMGECVDLPRPTR